MSKTYKAKVLEICDNGDAIIELTDELIQDLGWQVGDKIKFEIKNKKVYIINTSLPKRNNKNV